MKTCLVVDDSSPDGTADLAENNAQSEKVAKELAGKTETASAQRAVLAETIRELQLEEPKPAVPAKK